MKIISSRSSQPPMIGKINYAGWIDPSGRTYPVTGDTHAQWMMENYDWLESKGIRLPSRVEMIDLVRQVQTANVRNILVKQGWIAVQSPGRWHIKDMRAQSHTIQDAILSRSVSIKDGDWPIEVFIVDTGEFIRIEKEDLEDDLGRKQVQVLSYIRNKHGFTKEALLKTDENLVTFKHVIRMINGESQDWMVVDAYDLEGNPDLSMKFNIALMEAGLNKSGGEFYEKRLSENDPHFDYKSSVDKVSSSLKQMVDPKTKIIPEKEFGRDDRSIIYIQTPKAINDFI